MIATYICIVIQTCIFLVTVKEIRRVINTPSLYKESEDSDVVEVNWPSALEFCTRSDAFIYGERGFNGYN